MQKWRDEMDVIDERAQVYMAVLFVCSALGRRCGPGPRGRHVWSDYGIGRVCLLDGPHLASTEWFLTWMPGHKV